MRKYTLASPTARLDVDLRNHKEAITAAVHEIMPNADVVVERNYYLVEPTPSQGTAIRIGRAICQSELKYYCVHIPKLFTSVEIKEAFNELSKQKCHGGHK